MVNISILGAGFIGLNLVNFYSNREDYTIKVLDHKCKPNNLNEQVEWIQGELDSYNHVEKAVIGSDIVFHLISNTVPGDIVDVSEELFSNVSQLIQLLNICAKVLVKRIVFISSSSVYGTQSKLPISENVLPKPISFHGIQKLTLEYYLYLYSKNLGLDCKIMRLSNPYGKGQNLFGRQGFISILIGNLLTSKKTYIAGDGSIIRDYIYIDDVIEALHLMACIDSKEQVFNIGSGKGTSLNEIVYEISLYLGEKIEVEYTKGREVDIPISILDITKANKELCFIPKISLKDGLKKYINLAKLL